MYDSIESLASGFKAQNPEAANWGPNTVYSTLVWANPEARNLVAGSPEPKYASPDEFLVGYRKANADRFAGASDTEVLGDLRTNHPGLYDAWGFGGEQPGQPEETEEQVAPDDPLLQAFPNWIGPRPSRPLSEYKNGARLEKLAELNLSGRPGFLEGLKGDRRTDLVPYISDAVDAADAVSVIQTMRKLQDSDDFSEVSEEELVDLNLYLGLMEREASGSAFSKIGSGLRQMAVFMGEFAVYGALVAAALLEPTPAGELAVAGLAGKQVAAKGATKLARTQLRPWVKKVLGDAASDRLQKKILRNAAASGAVRGGGRVLASTSRMGRHLMTATADTMQEGAKRFFGDKASSFLAKAAGQAARQASHLGHAMVKTGIEQAAELAYIGAKTGETGTAMGIRRELAGVLSGDEDAERSLAAGAFLEGIENYTEMIGPDLMAGIGGLFGKAAGSRAGRAVLSPLSAKYKRLGEMTRKSLEEAGKSAGKDAGFVARAKQRLAANVMLAGHAGPGLQSKLDKLKGFGIDNFFEEYAEERAGDFIRGLFGFEGSLERNPLTRAIANMVPDSAEDAMVELAVLAFPTAGAVATQYAAGKVSDWTHPMQNKLAVARRAVGEDAGRRIDEAERIPAGALEEGADPRATDVLQQTEQDTLSDLAYDTMVDSVLEEANRGPVMGFIDWVLRNTVGLRVMPAWASSDGRGGLRMSTADRVAAAGAGAVSTGGIRLINQQLSTNGEFHRLMAVPANQRTTDQQDRLREIVRQAADEVRPELEHTMRQFSPLVFGGELDLPEEVWQMLASEEGVTVEDLQQISADLSARILAGELDGVLNRSKGGRVWLKTDGEIVDGMTRRHMRLLPFFNINAHASALRMSAAHFDAYRLSQLDRAAAERAERLAGADEATARQLWAEIHGIEREAAEVRAQDSLAGLTAGQVAQLNAAYEAYLNRTTVGSAALAQAANAPAKNDSVAVRLARAMLYPERTTESDRRNLRIALSLEANVPGDRLAEHLQRSGSIIREAQARTAPVVGEVVSEATMPTRSYLVAGIEDGAFRLVPMDNPRGESRLVSAADIGKYRIDRRNELEEIAFVREHVEVLSAEEAKRLRVAFFSPEALAKMEPMVRVEELDSDGKPTGRIDTAKSKYAIVVSGRSSADGKRIYITNFSRDQYDQAEETVEAAAMRTFRAMLLSGVDTSRLFSDVAGKGPGALAVLRSFREVATKVRDALRKEKTLTPEKAALLARLDESNQELLEQNLFELQGKTFLYADRGYSKHFDAFGRADTSVMRAEAELLAQLGGELLHQEGVEANQFLLQLRGDYTSMLGADAVAALAPELGRRPAVVATTPTPAKREPRARVKRPQAAGQKPAGVAGKKKPAAVPGKKPAAAAEQKPAAPAEAPAEASPTPAAAEGVPGVPAEIAEQMAKLEAEREALALGDPDTGLAGLVDNQDRLLEIEAELGELRLRAQQLGDYAGTSTRSEPATPPTGPLVDPAVVKPARDGLDLFFGLLPQLRGDVAHIVEGFNAAVARGRPDANVAQLADLLSNPRYYRHSDPLFFSHGAAESALRSLYFGEQMDVAELAAEQSFDEDFAGAEGNPADQYNTDSRKALQFLRSLETRAFDTALQEFFQGSAAEVVAGLRDRVARRTDDPDGLGHYLSGAAARPEWAVRMHGDPKLSGREQRHAAMDAARDAAPQFSEANWRKFKALPISADPFAARMQRFLHGMTLDQARRAWPYLSRYSVGLVRVRLRGTAELRPGGDVGVRFSRVDARPDDAGAGRGWQRTRDIVLRWFSRLTDGQAQELSRTVADAVVDERRVGFNPLPAQRSAGESLYDARREQFVQAMQAGGAKDAEGRPLSRGVPLPGSVWVRDRGGARVVPPGRRALYELLGELLGDARTAWLLDAYEGRGTLTTEQLQRLGDLAAKRGSDEARRLASGKLGWASIRREGDGFAVTIDRGAFQTSGANSLLTALRILEQAHVAETGTAVGLPWAKADPEFVAALLRGSEGLREAVRRRMDSPEQITRAEAEELANRYFDEYHGVMYRGAQAATYWLKDLYRALQAPNRAEELRKVVGSRPGPGRRTNFESLTRHFMQAARRSSISIRNATTPLLVGRMPILDAAYEGALSDIVSQSPGQPRIFVVDMASDMWRQVTKPLFDMMPRGRRELRDADTRMIRVEQAAGPGEQRSEDEYRAEYAMVREALRTGGDLPHMLNVGDKEIAYYVWLDRKAVLDQLEAYNAAGASYKPANVHDLMDVMYRMTSTRMLGSDTIGVQEAEARAAQKSIAKRLRVVSSAARKAPQLVRATVDGEVVTVPTHFRMFVATDIRVDGELLDEPINGHGIYAPSMAKWLAAAWGEQTARKSGKFMGWGSGTFIKSMNELDTTPAMSAIFGDANPNMMDRLYSMLMEKTGAEFATDTGAAKFFPKDQPVDALEFELDGKKVRVEGYLVDQETANLYETTNLRQPTRPKSAVRTVSADPNMAMRTPQQLALARENAKLLGDYAEMMTQALSDQDLRDWATESLGDILDPDLRAQAVAAGADAVYHPAVREQVLQRVRSRIASQLRLRVLSEKAVVVSSEPIGSRGPFADPHLRPAEPGRPGLVRININSPTDRPAWRVKPGKTAAEARAALQDYADGGPLEAAQEIFENYEGTPITGKERVGDLFENGELISDLFYEARGDTFLVGSYYIVTRVPGGINSVANVVMRRSIAADYELREGVPVAGNQNRIMVDGVTMGKMGVDMDGDTYQAILASADPLSAAELAALRAAALSGLATVPSVEGRKASEVYAELAPLLERAISGDLAHPASTELAQQIKTKQAEAAAADSVDELAALFADEIAEAVSGPMKLERRFLRSLTKQYRLRAAQAAYAATVLRNQRDSLLSLDQRQLDMDVNLGIGTRVVSKKHGKTIAELAATGLPVAGIETKTPAQVRQRQRSALADVGLGLRGALVVASDSLAAMVASGAVVPRAGETQEAFLARMEVVRWGMTGLSNQAFDIINVPVLPWMRVTLSTANLLAAHLLTHDKLDAAIEAEHSGDPTVPGTLEHAMQEWLDLMETAPAEAYRAAMDRNDLGRELVLDFSDRIWDFVSAVGDTIGRPFRSNDPALARLRSLRSTGLQISAAGRAIKMWARGALDTATQARVDADLETLGASPELLRYGMVRATVAGAEASRRAARQLGGLELPEAISRAYAPELGALGQPADFDYADLGRRVMIELLNGPLGSTPFGQLFIVQDNLRNADGSGRPPQPRLTSADAFIPGDMLAMSQSFWAEAAKTDLAVDGQSVPAAAIVPLVAYYQAREFGAAPSRFLGGVLSLMPAEVHQRAAAEARRAASETPVAPEAEAADAAKAPVVEAAAPAPVAKPAPFPVKPNVPAKERAKMNGPALNGETLAGVIISPASPAGSSSKVYLEHARAQGLATTKAELLAAAKPGALFIVSAPSATRGVSIVEGEDLVSPYSIIPELLRRGATVRTDVRANAYSNFNENAEEQVFGVLEYLAENDDAVGADSPEKEFREWKAPAVAQVPAVEAAPVAEAAEVLLYPVRDVFDLSPLAEAFAADAGVLPDGAALAVSELEAAREAYRLVRDAKLTEEYKLDGGEALRARALKELADFGRRAAAKEAPDGFAGTSTAEVEAALDPIARSMQRAEELKKLHDARRFTPPDQWDSAEGDAHYRKLPDGTWEVTLDDYSTDGEKLPPTVLVQSQAQVVASWKRNDDFVNQDDPSEQSYESIAESVDQWGREQGIVYDPKEAHALGEAFYSNIGAFNRDAPGLLGKIASVLLAQQRKLRRGERDWWKDAENQLVVSGYTWKPGVVQPNRGSGLRFVINPASRDIVWAAVGDVYSGIVRQYLRGKTRVDPKAPSADKLGLLADSVAVAIQGRRPQNYNEVGQRLRFGDFYIENPDASWVYESAPQKWIVTGEAGDHAQTFTTKEAAWNWAGTLPNRYITDRKIERLNELLKKAYIAVHGSLDPMAEKKPAFAGTSTSVLEAFNRARGAMMLRGENYAAWNRQFPDGFLRYYRDIATRMQRNLDAGDFAAVRRDLATQHVLDMGELAHEVLSRELEQAIELRAAPVAPVAPAAPAQLEFEFGGTSTVAVASVDEAGKATLRFSGNLTPKAIKLYANKTWPLEKALAESGYTKDAIAVIKNSEPVGADRSALDDIVRAAEAVTLRPITIEKRLTKAKAPNTGWRLIGPEQANAEGDFIASNEALHRYERFSTREDTEAFIAEQERGAPAELSTAYESLSVNQGQGSYMEVDILSDFPVPGQHGSFDKPNQMGWFRARAHDGKGVVTAVQTGEDTTAPAFRPGDGVRLLEIQEFQTAMATLFEFADWSDKSKTLANIDAALAKLRERLAQERVAGKDTGATENRIRKVEEARAQAADFDAPWAWRGPNNETFLMNALGKYKTHEEVFVNAITQWAKNPGFTPDKNPFGQSLIQEPVFHRGGYGLTAFSEATDRGTGLGGRKDGPGIYFSATEEQDEEYHSILTGRDAPSEGYRAYIDLKNPKRVRAVVKLRRWTDGDGHNLVQTVSDYDVTKTTPEGNADGTIIEIVTPAYSTFSYPQGRIVSYPETVETEYRVDSARQVRLITKNQGFAKVRFPTGETAARVEGHQVLADRLTKLQEERQRALDGATRTNAEEHSDLDQASRLAIFTYEAEIEPGLTYESWLSRASGGPRTVEAIDAEIQHLKTEGIEKLAPIEAFYEKRVGKIVRTMGSQPVTDANGNTWNEISLPMAGTSTRELEGFATTEPGSPLDRATKQLDTELQVAGSPWRSAELRADPLTSPAHYELMQGYTAERGRAALPILQALAEGRLAEALDGARSLGDLVTRERMTRAVHAALSNQADLARATELEGEPSAEFFSGTSTYGFDAAVRDQLNWLMRAGGTPRAHLILKEATYLANALVEKSNIDFNRIWNPFFHDANRKTVRKFYRTKDGKSAPVTGTRTWFSRGYSHTYSEAESNLLSRVMAAARAIMKNERDERGRLVVTYGGARRLNQQGDVDKAASWAVSLSEAGVPLAADGGEANFELVADILRDWNQSSLKQMLLNEFGRTEAELDPAALAKEMNQLYAEVRQKVNRHAALTLAGPDFLSAVEDYGPQTYRGNGFDSVANREIVYRVNQAAARGDRSGQGSGLVAADLDISQHGRLASTDTQKQVYLGLLRELYGEGVGADSEKGRWELVAHLDRRELNAKILRLAIKSEVVKSQTLGEAYAMAPGRAALISALRNTIALYATREYTARSLERSYPSYYTAYLESGGRLEPTQTPPQLEFSNYVADVSAILRSQVVSQLYMLTPDQDGKFLVIGAPDLEQVARLGSTNMALVQEATVRAQVETLEREFDITDTPGQTPYEKLDWLIRNKLEPSGYFEGYDTEVYSPYDSIRKFYVKSGKPARLFQHIVGQRPRKIIEVAGRRYDALQAVSNANQFMKHLALSWSAFFGTAGIESLTAGTGLRRNIWWRAKSAFGRMRELSSQIERGDPSIAGLVYDLHRAGLDLSGKRLAEGSDSAVDRMIDRGADWVERNLGKSVVQPYKSGARFLSGRFWSEFLMGKFFPGMKLWAATDMIDQMHDQLPGVSRQELMRAVAPIVNAAYGGTPWANYAWATPRTTFWLNMSMFSPQWTWAAWSVAGGGQITGSRLGNYMTPDMEKFVFLRNWPAMYVLALQAFPNLLQAAIYVSTKALGKAGPDDEPLAIMNEEGKGGLFPSIDVTPIARMLPGYEGTPTGQRRIYIRFGKQSYEVLNGWLRNPQETLMRKSSMIVKLGFEQMFGHSPGSPDFKLPFYGKGFAGLLSSPRGFSGSRVGVASEKFLPMSFVSALKSPDSRVFAAFVPSSKGMSKTRAHKDIVQILDAYADSESWGALEKNLSMRANLELLASDYLRALELNGYDPEQVLKAARGEAMPKYYGNFLRALEKNDQPALERAARSIYRLHGTTQSLLSSFSNRIRGLSRPPPSEEELEAVRQAFGKYAPPTFVDRAPATK